MVDKNRDTDQGRTGASSTIQQGHQQHDWTTRDPQQFLTNFRDVISHARDAGVTEQQLLDSISQNYSGGTGSTGSGNTR